MNNKEDNFYTNKNYLELKNKLDFEDAQLFVQVVGEAIQYGIARMSNELLKKYDKPI